MVSHGSILSSRSRFGRNRVRLYLVDSVTWKVSDAQVSSVDPRIAVGKGIPSRIEAGIHKDVRHKEHPSALWVPGKYSGRRRPALRLKALG